MNGPPVTVAETPLFARQASKIWSEEERDDFIDHIARFPLAGEVVQETGGVRKVRWTRAGSGKRGGARVIYFYHRPDTPLYLLMVYSKAQREDLTASEKIEVKKFVGVIKAASSR